MTVLASLPPDLARLFERIDAAEPTSERLRTALHYWQSKRSGRLTPSVADVADRPPTIAGNVFVFRHSPSNSDWQLDDSGAAARALLGPPTNDARLSRLGAKRIAVRLRRVFEMVADTGEPVAATFEVDGKATRRRQVEVLVAPLSTGDARIDAVFGAIDARWEAGR